MHYNSRHDVIELGDDVQDIQGLHITEEDGQTVAYLKVVLDPRKQYQSSEEVYVHLTNGINHRTLGPFSHATPLTLVAPLEEKAVSKEGQEGEQEPAVEQGTGEQAAPRKTKKGQQA